MNSRDKRIVTFFTLFLSYTSISSAETIVREVQLTTAADQIFVGGFGSGVFYSPTFELATFDFNVGDTIDVTVRFDQPVVVEAGEVELESVGAFVGASSHSLIAYSDVNWDFLDVQGELLSDHVFMSGVRGEARAIGNHTAGIPGFDLTDTRFSFQGVHFSMTLTAGTGFPVVFTEARIAVQTQGGIRFGVIPEPCTLTVFIGCLITLSASGMDRRQTWLGRKIG